MQRLTALIVGFSLLLSVVVSTSDTGNRCPATTKIQQMALKWKNNFPICGDEDRDRDQLRSRKSPGDRFLTSKTECELELKSWNDSIKKIKEDILKDVNIAHKRFFRFRISTPVATANGDVDMSAVHQRETLTWVSVFNSFQYMLYYPHNFQTLSLGTLSIIAMDIDIEGYCDPKCGGKCGSQALRRELQKLLDETQSHYTDAERMQYRFQPLCLQIDYNMSDILSNTSASYHSYLMFFNTRECALPDLMYYWRFLKLFLTHEAVLRSTPGSECVHNTPNELPNYCCYWDNGGCFIKTLLRHYWVIVMMGVLLWLYVPLLIHYFPSSNPHSNHVKGMFPQYKSPIYLGRFVQYLMCYYSSKNSSASMLLLVRIRRVLFFLLLSLLAFRFFTHPCYKFYYCIILVLLMFSASLPRYLSEHIKTELPEGFPLLVSSWMYPEGLVKASCHGDKFEYQILAHVMQERIFLTVDVRFWQHLLRNSFHELANCTVKCTSFWIFIKSLLWVSLSFALGLSTSLLSLAIACSYFLVPLPFFCKEMMLALWRSRVKHPNWLCGGVGSWFVTSIAYAHGILLCSLVPWAMTLLLVLCLFVSEILIFTFIGVTLTPSIALQYFTIITSILFVACAMVHDLHSGYNTLLNETILCLENLDQLGKVVSDLVSVRKCWGAGLSLTTGSKTGTRSMWLEVRSPEKQLFCTRLMMNDGGTTYISTKVYFSIVESVRPIRRQVVLVLLKIMVIIFFVVVASWVKNVYHLQENMSGIFSTIDSVVVFFIPGLLHLLVNKGRFGKRPKEVLAREVHHAIMEYIRRLSHNVSAKSLAVHSAIHTERIFKYSLKM